MLRLDVRRPKLTGLIACKKDDPPRLFRIAFEHAPPSTRLTPGLADAPTHPMQAATSAKITLYNNSLIR